MQHIRIYGHVTEYDDESEMVIIKFPDGTTMGRWVGYDLHSYEFPNGAPEKGYPIGTDVYFYIGQ